MKKIVAAALLILALLLPSSALADEYYTIESDDVYITVHENNVIDVTEILTVDFSAPRHGIFYGVAYQGVTPDLVDGEWVETEFKNNVYDLNVREQEFELSRENSGKARYLVAKIGDPDVLVSGRQVYTITYKCNLGDNHNDALDEFYRTIISCYGTNTIQSASFTIEFPKDFDSTKVAINAGGYGTNSKGVEWEMDGLKIKGHTTEPLRSNEFVTVRAELPDDYFTGESDPAAAWSTGIYIVTAICVALSLLLWIALGNDKKVFPTVEFYAPDGMTPAEAGYVIDGCVDDRDVIALLLYWADKGYLKIVEIEKEEFELQKLKDLPESAKGFEKVMFARLFAGRDAVAVSSLKQSFYTTMEQTKTSVTNWFEGTKSRRVFTCASKRARSAMAFITMTPIAAVMFKLAYDLTDNNLLMSVGIAVFGGWLISLPILILVNVFEKWRGAQPGRRMSGLITSLLLLAAVFAVYIFVIPAMMSTVNGLGAEVTYVTAGAAIVMLALTAVMRKRTDQGSEWYTKLLGFKNFIDKAEKERIKLLVEQNPSYFYNVLPYAYVLGVTDKWAKNFEGIGVEPPIWYSGYYGANMFNTIIFASMMTRGMGGFQTAMTSRPAPSGSGFGGGSGGFGGGGFGGGGGFSGGGFGGGGAGGSW